MQRAGERAFQTEGIARAKYLGSKQAYLKTKRKKLDREMVECDIRELGMGPDHERPCKLQSGVRILF